jgi:elongation of very long chain fatty acids protein 4
MDMYISAMDKIGDAIISAIDPDSSFTGYTKGWMFTEFHTAITIAFVYLAFVIVGSAIMKAGVPAMDPYPIKFFYNVSQIMLCAYMTIEAGMIAYRNGYGICCNDYNRDDPPLANLLWLFYASKIWDFWDTIFIVLGKKWRQLSFLHVYHHFTIFLFYWLNANSQYDGDVYLTIVLNGFIHTVMYTYYFICMHTKDPKTGKSLPIWWKSSLTMMQLIQFVTMMTQAIYLMFNTNSCPGNSFRNTATYFVYILSLFFLFAQFFVSSYLKPKKKKSA